MRYSVIAIGGLKRGFYQEGCQHFLGRLSAYAKIELLELKEGKGRTPEQVKEQEGKALLKAADGYLICLDEKGRQLGSEQLASKISLLENRAISHISLLIGGAEGLSETVKKAVSDSWSLSKLTLPHELARLLLLEQLYRAETIRAGHPYHRE